MNDGLRCTGIQKQKSLHFKTVVSNHGRYKDPVSLNDDRCFAVSFLGQFGLAAEAVGGDTARVLPFALAVELVHTYSLIHDDLPAMDDDELRRGRATCHKAFDEATAILAGDALQAHAFEILAASTLQVDDTRRLEMIRLLATASGSNGMAGGQVLSGRRSAAGTEDPGVVPRIL